MCMALYAYCQTSRMATVVDMYNNDHDPSCNTHRVAITFYHKRLNALYDTSLNSTQDQSPLLTAFPDSTAASAHICQARMRRL